MGSGISIMPLPTPNGTTTQIVTSPQTVTPEAAAEQLRAEQLQSQQLQAQQFQAQQAPAPAAVAAPAPVAAAPVAAQAPVAAAPAPVAAPPPAVGPEECINLSGTLRSELQNNTPIAALNSIKDITNYTKISFSLDNTAVSISVKVCEFNTSNHALVMYLLDSNNNPILDLSNNNIDWTINSVPFKNMNINSESFQNINTERVKVQRKKNNANIQKVGVIPSNSRNTFTIGSTNNFSFVPGRVYKLLLVVSDTVPPSLSSTAMWYQLTLSPAQGFQNQKKSFEGYYPPNKLVGTEYYPF